MGSRKTREISKNAKTYQNKCKYADGIKEIDEVSTQYPTAIRLSRVLTRVEKDIMLFIFDTSKGYGAKMPNQLIAYFCDCSETTVSIALSKLAKLNYINITYSSGIRYLSVTKENLGHMWGSEIDNINKWLKEVV